MNSSSSKQNDLRRRTRRSLWTRAGASTALVALVIAVLWFANIVAPSRENLPPIRTGSPPPVLVFEARVKSVVDGDTVDLENGSVVRLKGIDAPEKEQIGYAEATRALRDLVGGRSIRLAYDSDDDTTDRYGRLLAYLATDRCAAVNERLLLDGRVWIYRSIRDRTRREAYLDAQRKAMDRHAGLWGCLRDPGDPIIGHTGSRVFHKPDCAHGRKMAAKNQRTFEGLRSAFWEGYSPCRSCFTQPLEGR